MIGAIIRQGPHQGAQQSRSTGRLTRSTSCAKLASVTTSGLAPALKIESLAPHFPQTGWSDLARSSMRFFAPHLGQVMTGIRALLLQSELDNCGRQMGTEILKPSS